MGRVGEKIKVRKGLWSPEEDERLATHIARFGVSCWSSIPDLAGLQRCGKSCRLRWMNYLRPDLKRGRFSQQEEDLIMALHDALGNSWSQIAARLPGRSDNEIKNFWNARLRKKLRQKDTAAATGAESRRRGDGVGDVEDRKPAAVFDPFPHNSAPSGHQAIPTAIADSRRSSGGAAIPAANAVTQLLAAGDEARKRSEALLPADGGDVPAESVTAPSTSASKEATRDVVHCGGGDNGFLAVMIDDEASLLLGEYYYGLDGGCHDGFSFWPGGQVFC